MAPLPQGLPELPSLQALSALSFKYSSTSHLSQLTPRHKELSQTSPCGQRYSACMLHTSSLELHETEAVYLGWPERPSHVYCIFSCSWNYDSWHMVCPNCLQKVAHLHRSSEERRAQLCYVALSDSEDASVCMTTFTLML